MRPKMAKMRLKIAKMKPKMVKMRAKMFKMRPKMVKMRPKMPKMRGKMVKRGPEMAKMRPKIAKPGKKPMVFLGFSGPPGQNKIIDRSASPVRVQCESLICLADPPQLSILDTKNKES